MNRHLGSQITAIVCVLLMLGGCHSESDGTMAVSGEIPRPASLDGIDPQIVAFIEGAIGVIEDDPDLALPRAGLGMIYQAQEMFEPSRIAYRQALAIEPDNARWLYHLARVERRLDDADAAIVAISRSIELEPRYASSYRQRGAWRLRLEDVGAAEEDFRKAIQLAPQDPAGHVGLARTLIAQNRREEAAKLLAERGLSLSSAGTAAGDDPWTIDDIARFRLDFASYVRLAETLASAGQLERALEAFEALHELEPEDASVLLQLGRTYRAVGRHEEALATLERGIELHPRDPELLGDTAAAYRAVDQPERALEVLDRALEIKPDDGLAHARRGVILQNLERYPQAAESYRRSLSYRPQDTRVMLLYGDCLGSMQQYEEAVATWRHALTIDENNANLHARLGFMLHRLGRFGDAEAALAKALELQPDNPEWAELLEQSRRAVRG